MLPLRLLSPLILLALAGAATAQPGRGNPTAPASAAPASETKAADARPALPAADNYKQTQHTSRVGGSPVAYTATAGTLALTNATGKLRANVFFVAYTKDGVPAGGRPIAFVFNGGPGSSSERESDALQGRSRRQRLLATRGGP